MTNLQSRCFAFYAGAALDKAALVGTELLKQVALLRAEGLTAEELKSAKAEIIGQRKIARQDLGGFAMTTALDELHGLGYAYTDTEDAQYEAVTLSADTGAQKTFVGHAGGSCVRSGLAVLDQS